MKQRSISTTFVAGFSIVSASLLAPSIANAQAVAGTEAGVAIGRANDLSDTIHSYHRKNPPQVSREDYCKTLRDGEDQLNELDKLFFRAVANGQTDLARRIGNAGDDLDDELDYEDWEHPQTPCWPPRAGLYLLGGGGSSVGTYNGTSSTWAGPYVGMWAGGGWGSNSWSNPDDGPLGSVNSHGFLIGVYAGYNWQFGNIVTGIEFGGAFANIKGDFDKFGWNFSGNVRGLEELTARFGVTTGPNNNALLFVKGGGALTQYSLKSDWPEIGTQFQATKTFGGWTAGAGIEYRLTPKFSYRLEYSYYNFGGGSADLSPSTDVLPYRVEIGKTSVNVVSLGFNYALGK